MWKNPILISKDGNFLSKLNYAVERERNGIQLYVKYNKDSRDLSNKFQMLNNQYRSYLRESLVDGLDSIEIDYERHIIAFLHSVCGITADLTVSLEKNAQNMREYNGFAVFQVSLLDYIEFLSSSLFIVDSINDDEKNYIFEGFVQYLDLIGNKECIAIIDNLGYLISQLSKMIIGGDVTILYTEDGEN